MTGLHNTTPMLQYKSNSITGYPKNMSRKCRHGVASVRFCIQKKLLYFYFHVAENLKKPMFLSGLSISTDDDIIRALLRGCLRTEARVAPQKAVGGCCSQTRGLLRRRRRRAKFDLERPLAITIRPPPLNVIGHDL